MARGGARPGAGRPRKRVDPVMIAVAALAEAERALRAASAGLDGARRAVEGARTALAAEPPLMLLPPPAGAKEGEAE